MVQKAQAHAGDINVFVDPSTDEVTTSEITVLDGSDIDEPTSDAPSATLEGEAIRLKIHELSSTISVAYWELSELVAMVSNKKLYKTWGFGTFEEWAKNECDVGRRKAFYFVKIQNYFNDHLKKQLQGSPELYEQAVAVAKEIGWSKALKLASENVITKENIGDVLEAAQTLSVDELETKCRAVFKDLSAKDKDSSIESNTMKMVRKSFQLTTYDENVVSLAISKAKESLKEGASDSTALAWICGEYTATGSMDITDALSKMERLLGITIVAVMENENRIIHGADAIVRIAGAAAEDDEEEG